MMDDLEDSLQPEEGVGPFIVNDNTVVEKILNSREKEGREEFLAKYKGRSYMHCEWKTLEELEESDKRVAGKVKRFKGKKSQQWMDMDDEDFNQDFTVVERVLAIEMEGEDQVRTRSF